MTGLRFLNMLSLVVWVGGITFFAFVLAPTVFSVLPTRELAGSVVSRSLRSLHWIGIISGILFLVTSVVIARMDTGSLQLLSAKNLVVLLMIALTLISQFAIGGKMQALRQEMKVIDAIPTTDARRVEFNQLHRWSTRTESAVLLLGLAALYLAVRRQ
jgi:uncharacterized membrane protein